MSTSMVWGARRHRAASREPSSQPRILPLPFQVLIAATIALAIGTPSSAWAFELPCSDAPSFEILSTSGNYNFTAMGVSGLTGDVVGAASEIGVAVKWDADGNRFMLENPDFPDRAFNPAKDRIVPVEISRDGSTILGVVLPAYTPNAPNPQDIVVWTEGAVESLGLLPNYGDGYYRSTYLWGPIALGTTDEGLNIIGGTRFENPGGSPTFEAFELTPELGPLPLSSPHDRSDATGITGDGRVVVGRAWTSSAYNAAKWVDGAFSFLSRGCGDASKNKSGAMDVSADGRVIVGWSTTGDCSDHVPTVWSDGSRREIPVTTAPTSRELGRAHAVSEDGRIVVGVDGRLFDGRAFLWDERNGTRDLKDLLSTQYGLADELKDWVLLAANDVSLGADGSIWIVGIARDVELIGRILPFRVKIPCLDDDRDGLCNEWEEQGYVDVDEDGGFDPAQDLILDGSDPNRMNIYVEVDAFKTTNLSSKALEDIEWAFLKVPYDKTANPGRRNGIILRLEKGDLDLPPLASGQYSAPAGCGKMPVEFDGLKDGYFGTALQRTNADVIALKKKLYRYVIVGGRSSGGFSGKAQFFGPNAIITLANFTPVHGTDEMQAGTLMHELGHTLGLGHGGGIDGKPVHRLFKPNYHSVMNYTWQFRSARGVSNPLGRFAYWASWRLDYSRSLFNTLDESAIEETPGIGGSEGHRKHFVATGPLPARAEREVGAVDFNRDGFTGTVCLSCNVNNVDPRKSSAKISVLRPSDDWSYLSDNFCSSFRHGNWSVAPSAGSCAGALGPEDDEDDLLEMTPADVEALAQDYPIDCNANGVDDQIELDQGLDSDDNQNGVLDGCEPLEGDCNADDVVDDQDRSVLIAAFGRLEGEPEYRECVDLDGDQEVNFVDYQLWLSAKERFEAPPPAADSPACGLIGLEPLCLAGWLVARRRAEGRAAR